MLAILPCLDSPELAAARRLELNIPRQLAATLGRSAVDAVERGHYTNASLARVDWSHDVQAARAAKRSIPPEAALPAHQPASFARTRIQVTNETTLLAAKRLVDTGARPLALNFANGLHPGGGFLTGALAQEEGLCRSSSLYHTLAGDPMYEAHGLRDQPDSTDWAIYSPRIPVFRNDAGSEFERPWLLDVITCAAPVAQRIRQPAAGDLLQRRIHRVLAIAQAFGHSTLVLGAWGCGAFANDPARTARDFRTALEGEFDAAFAEVVFAIADWSKERRYLGPFRDVFRASDR